MVFDIYPQGRFSQEMLNDFSWQHLGPQFVPHISVIWSTFELLYFNFFSWYLDDANSISQRLYPMLPVFFFKLVNMVYN